MLQKYLTIWIPTYQREEKLKQLLKNLYDLNVFEIAEVVISDNDQKPDLQESIIKELPELKNKFIYRFNPANLSAGANFLRAFEYCITPWLMIVGDDDSFSPDYFYSFRSLIPKVPDNIVAIKFDSSLFGRQSRSQSIDFSEYVQGLPRSFYPAALNNLCLVSNWMFRCKPCRTYLASAYLGYSSKLSHILPALKASTLDKKKILFSDLQPIQHGSSGDSWPKAPTWFEMAMTISSFSGFIEPQDRRSLLKLIFHSDWKRNVAKCLRVQQFYSNRINGINPWRIHLHLSLISVRYCFSLFICFPLLFLPARFLPRVIQDRLGHPGSLHRW